MRPEALDDPDLRRVLEPDGSVVEGAEPPDLDDGELRRMYAELVLARRFDERAVSLQRQGRLGTYPPMAGQEGAQVGSAHAIRDDDLVVYQYRENAIPMVRGVDPADLLRYWRGQEEGNAALVDADVFPMNIAIGSQLPHAVGLAWGAEYRGDDRIVAVHFGDGATSEGDFHEAMNFAGVFDLPVVFVCHNNGYAISVPRERQTASDTIAEKAAAYGFEGVRVDGMDPLAVYRAIAEAAERARTGGTAPRPTLVEAVTYRYGAHTTADDPSVYREDEEVEAWRRLDPLDRFEAYCRERGVLDDDAVETTEAEAAERLEAAVEAAESTPVDPTSLFEDVHAEPPESLLAQRADFERLLERHGEDALTED